MEDQQYEHQVNSARNFDDEIQKVTDESSLLCTEGRISRCPHAETSTSTDTRTELRDNATVEGSSRNVGTSSQRNCLSEHKELVPPYQVSAGHSHPESLSDSNNTASTSYVEQQYSVSVNVSANKDRINNVDDPAVSGVSQISHETARPSGSISQENGNPGYGEISVENDTDAETSVRSSSVPVSQVSDTTPTSQVSEDEPRHETIPSGLGILVSNRERGHGNDGLLQVDVVAISSNILSRNNTDADDRNASRGGRRRLFRDVISRSSYRSLGDSPTILFSTGGADDSGSQDRWLVDFGEDLSNDGVGTPSGYRGSRIHRLNERMRHSRSEVILNIWSIQCLNCLCHLHFLTGFMITIMLLKLFSLLHTDMGKASRRP